VTGQQKDNNRSGPISHDKRNPPEVKHVALMTDMLGFEHYSLTAIRREICSCNKYIKTYIMLP
jgi:hypothetical protein